MQDVTLPQQIVELFPANPFYDLTGSRATSTIAVVMFAVFLGFAYLQVVRRERGNSGYDVKKGIDAIYDS